MRLSAAALRANAIDLKVMPINAKAGRLFELRMQGVEIARAIEVDHPTANAADQGVRVSNRNACVTHLAATSTDTY